MRFPFCFLRIGLLRIAGGGALQGAGRRAGQGLLVARGAAAGAGERHVRQRQDDQGSRGAARGRVLRRLRRARRPGLRLLDPVLLRDARWQHDGRASRAAHAARAHRRGVRGRLRHVRGRLPRRARLSQPLPAAVLGRTRGLALLPRHVKETNVKNKQKNGKQKKAWKKQKNKRKKQNAKHKHPNKALCAARIYSVAGTAPLRGGGLLEDSHAGRRLPIRRHSLSRLPALAVRRLAFTQ